MYVYIYKKLSNKWKNFKEQKVFFFFRFYILCENFSKIGPIIADCSSVNIFYYCLNYHFIVVYLAAPLISTFLQWHAGSSFSIVYS